MAADAPIADGAKPFLAKAYELVDDPSTDAIISWSAAGDHFVVRNPEAFTSEVLPKNFKHNNFSSFIRQLNTYGFRKMEKDKWAFGHDCFVRGKPELLANITRKRGAPSRRRGGAGSEAGGADELSDEENPQAKMGPLASFPFSIDGTAEQAMTPPLSGAGGGAAAAAKAKAAAAAGSDAATATTVLAEIVRMSQLQATMLQQVKELQRALGETQESQRMTRTTVNKVVGFLQHMHGGSGGGGGGGGGDGGGGCAVQGSSQPGLLHGPLPTDMFGLSHLGTAQPDAHPTQPPQLPTPKRRRLVLTDESDAPLPPGSLAPGGGAAVVADSIPKLSIPPTVLAHPNAPPVAVNLMPALHEPMPTTMQSLFSPKTIEASHKLERELAQVADAPAGDLDAIDIDTVLSLLSGIESEASRPIEAA